MEEVIRGRVLRESRGHRADHRDVVHAEPDVREQVADRRAAGAAGPELPRRGEGLAVVVELGRLRLHLERLAVLPIQPRLGIEGVHLRGPALHEEEDDVPGPRPVVRRSVRVATGRWTRGGVRSVRTVRQEGRQCRRAEPAGAMSKHLAASRRGWGESSAVVHVRFRARDATRRGGGPRCQFNSGR